MPKQDALFPDPSDDARFREAMLDNVSDDTARAVRELADYDWRSPEARESYEQIRQMLQRDVVDAQFKGLSQAMSSPQSPEDAQRVKDMMADLNDMMAAHRQRRGCVVDVRGIHGQARGFLPR